jgi:hypothetical protein
MALTRIPEFLDLIADIPRGADDQVYWSRAANEIKHLKTGKRVPRGTIEVVRGYAITTVRSVLSDYRNAVRMDARLGPRSPVLKYLRPSIADQAFVKDMHVKRVYEVNTTRRPIDAEDFIDKATWLLSASKPLLRAVGIQLLTGRRNIELFRTFGSTPARKHSPLFDTCEGYTLFFAGQAKTRNASSARLGPYEIPVLAEPAMLLKAIRMMQRDYPIPESLDSKQIDSKIASTLGQNVRDHFRDDKGGLLTPKDLRAIYATIAYEYYAPPGYGVNAYFSHILGHSEGDFQTAMSYGGFYVLGHKRDYDRAFRKAARDAIAELRQRQLTERDRKKQMAIVATIDKYQSYIPPSD